MEDAAIANLVEQGMATLKKTNQGYTQHSPAYWNNPTTNWYKGLNLLQQAVDELRRARQLLVVVSVFRSTPSMLTFTIKVS